jgi:hypothetical protein
MQSFTVSYTIKFVVKFADNYVWNKYNELYNVKTGRRIKQVRNGGSIGYNIAGKFYSCKWLKENKQIVKPKKQDCPF